MTMNLMDSLTNGMTMMIGNGVLSAGLEMLEAIVVCVAMVKVIQVTYKVIKEGYEDKDGRTVVGLGFGVGAIKALPHVFELIRIYTGV